MPRAPSAKLASLTPTAVAEEVCSIVVQHLVRATMPMGITLALYSSRTVTVDGVEEEEPWLTPNLPDAAQLSRESDLGLTMQALTEYAQKGLPVWDWETHVEALDALAPVAEALFAPAARGDYPLGELATDADPETDYGLVLVGAWARAQIAARQPVRVRDLAVLSGLAATSVHALARRGEIVVEDERVAAKEARRWLGARGVAGFRA